MAASSLPPFDAARAQQLFRTDLTECELYVRQYLSSEQILDLAQSHSMLADICRERARPRGDDQVNLLEQALGHLKNARERVDAHIAQNYPESVVCHPHHPLSEICQIINIGVDALMRDSNKLRQAIVKEQIALENRLEPQLQDRDRVKASMGKRWKENPAPKNDYAERRRKLEERLRELDGMIQRLDRLDQDAKNLHHAV